MSSNSIQLPPQQPGNGTVQATSKVLAQAAVAKAEEAEFKASLDKLKQEQQLRKQQVIDHSPPNPANCTLPVVSVAKGKKLS